MFYSLYNISKKFCPACRILKKESVKTFYVIHLSSICCAVIFMMEVSGSSTKLRVDLTVMHFLWDVIHSTKFQAPDRLRKGFPTSKYGTKSWSLSQLYERQYIGHHTRFWYLLHWQAAKAQASLHLCAHRGRLARAFCSRIHKILK